MKLYWMYWVLALGVGCSWLCPKPKPCPTCPPLQVVEVQKPCMDPLPALPKVKLPPPDAAGVVHLDEESYRGLLELLAKVNSYLATQLERCAEAPATQP